MGSPMASGRSRLRVTVRALLNKCQPTRWLFVGGHFAGTSIEAPSARGLPLEFGACRRFPWKF